MAVCEDSGSHSVLPKCLYVITPTGGTTSDTKELSCLRAPTPDTVGYDRCKERLPGGINKKEER